jgi:uncharacterized circularly permuted ATP-grasp superfamily protein
LVEGRENGKGRRRLHAHDGDPRRATRITVHDDDFLDPLAFARFPLGARIDVARQVINVTLATGAPASRTKRSTATPAIAKFRSGEEPIPKNVPTWRCRERST